ncbi:epoxide hydrolase [Jiangella ureilytica]|uniref:Epoxide hydrolase n=1 Tax=Jiangella ureilytica TaxID=2530374 RepID=A0A4R4S6A0_9ACTN|nr:epoxide hydrolase [Jiangella ureilytica]TDC56673.1 epoxide hydrolase [Jiangella ureilytica]
MTPFSIHIPQPDLDDLRERLARTRWTPQLPGDGWERGVPADWVRDVAEYWRTGYDWRAREARLNAFPQFVEEIDGLGLHYLHVRSPEPDALPLLLAHGWPNSFVEFVRTIPLLTDPRAHGADPAQAFHVVVPSAPGFGFSAAPRTTGFGIGSVAVMYGQLMERLGYDRYGTQGGDLGAYVAPELARRQPDRVVGVHIDGGFGFPTEDDVPGMTQAERAEWDMMQQWMAGGVDHHALLRVAPQTFGYGWHDSPVALLAWHAHKFHEFSMSDQPLFDVIDRDLFLDNVSVYWFTKTAATSSWPMYEGLAGADGGGARFEWPEGQKAVPSGVYGGGSPLMRRLAEEDNTIVHWPEGNPGRHHFVAMEEPAGHVADIRAFFAQVR